MLKKVCNGISTALIVVLVILVVLLYGSNLLGIRPYTVLSGSMEPAYHTGSMVYVKPVAEEDLQVGDTVSFRLDGGTVATHRIVEIDRESRKITTKGDANETTDGAVSVDQVIGKVIFTVPGLGYAASYLASASGKLAVGALFLVAVALMLLPELFRKKQG